MFSAEDIRTIFRLLPPEKSSKDEYPGATDTLFLSSGGDGFLTRKHVVNGFESLVTRGTESLPISAVSLELDVGTDVVLQLIRECPHLALLSESKLSVIVKTERDSIDRHLQDLLAHQLVSKAAFSQEHDISLESIDFLARSHESRAQSRGDLLEVNNHLLTRAYNQTLLDSLRFAVDTSFSDATIVELSPQTYPGRPPIWYLSRLLEQLLKDSKLESEFRVEKTSELIRCIPNRYFSKKRDEAIESLQHGTVAYLDMRDFTKQFGELYPSYEGVRDHFATFSDITLSGTSAISNTWLTKVGNECIQGLNERGGVDLKAEVIIDVHPAVRKEIFDNVEQQITTLFEERKPDHSIHRIEDFILTGARYEAERNILFDCAKAQALKHWQTLKDQLDKDLKFRLSDILATVPADQPILRAVAQEKGSDKVIEEHFWAEISSLELRNEGEFSVFWTERVLSRVHNYNEGLRAVDDTKLRDQLADLLSIHLQKELIPDAVSKARSQGLLCSRKTWKNAQKLESVLKAGMQDVSGVLASLNKFGKKQGIQNSEPASLAEAKGFLTGDLVRRMSKQRTDAPTLFLLLVLVLFGRCNSGVVYATGKFAPKLLKQLKSSLSADQYEQVEQWKERAKTGALTAEDKEAMRQLAGEN